MPISWEQIGVGSWRLGEEEKSEIFCSEEPEVLPHSPLPPSSLHFFDPPPPRILNNCDIPSSPTNSCSHPYPRHCG